MTEHQQMAELPLLAAVAESWQGPERFARTGAGMDEHILAATLSGAAQAWQSSGSATGAAWQSRCSRWRWPGGQVKGRESPWPRTRDRHCAARSMALPEQ